MNILVIGDDPGLFKENSESRSRAKAYSELFEQYHVISSGGSNPYFSGNLFVWPARPGFLRPFSSFAQARGVIARHKIDIIDAQDAGEFGAVAFALARLYKIPFRLQIHADIFSPYFRGASLKERARYMAAKFLVPRASCVRAVSARIKKSFEYKIPGLGGKISVLPIFTDISKFIAANPDGAYEERLKNFGFRMITAGRFVEKEKNFSMLINMMPDFLKICPDSVLFIVGDGPDREMYEEKVRSYGLENHVILEKWRNDLPSLYKSFELFLMPSNYEGWGRAAIEAMASGLPVIMTDVGIAGEVIINGQNGLVVPVGDADKFLGACVDIYKNPEKLRRLAEAGKKTVQGLKPKSFAEYLTVYKNSLESCESR